MTSSPSTAGRHARTTRRSVRLNDRLARALITVGGWGTIISVLTVCLFLVWVTAPLILPASLTAPAKHSLGAPPPEAVAHLEVDEHLLLGAICQTDGVFRAVRLDTGERLAETRLSGSGQPTAMAFSRDGALAVGQSDGSVRLGRLRFASEFINADKLPEELKKLRVDQSASYQGGVLQRIPGNQWRVERMELSAADPTRLSQSAITLLDLTVTSSGSIFAALSADRRLYVESAVERKNLLTGKTVTKLTGGEVAVQWPADAGPPHWLFLSGLGDNAWLLWRNGRLMRFDTRDITAPKLVETTRVIDEAAHVTAAAMLLGKTTLLVGDDRGRVRAWFRIQPTLSSASDGKQMAQAREIATGPAAVTAIASSARSRLIAVGYADGRTRLANVTTGASVVETAPAESIRTLVIAPKDDALVALTPAGLATWQINAPHAEVSLASLFAPVWYEGQAQPEHVWQSSAATDEFEPKYGLMPLIFGTIKATLYSMLFGAPIALLAAIYTSEFLSVRFKSRIKPLVEVMASLPSVVLGFLAGIVIAPAVENSVVEVLLAMLLTPLACVVAGYLWQLLPRSVVIRGERYRFFALLLVIPLAVVVAGWCAAPVERLLFAGDIKRWLDGQVGSAVGGWLLVCLPAAALLTALLSSRVVTPQLRNWAGNWPHGAVALAELVKFALLSVVAVALAGGMAWLLAAGGFDARHWYLGTYVQRNAMIVGFIMGFAVIPIIYTIAEDALSAVPSHLRAASLGAGATPWQTAVRVIVPTAASGLFSAVMVGFGRAVGETMIVLMAAGNTPIMDWNLFNGFRTLSANIAVELPEAVQNSTHYRILFLSALCLFVLTFVVNTVAEAVRDRFRKKAFQL